MLTTLNAFLVTLTVSPYFFAFLGLIIGSFLNVVVYRLPLIMHRQWVHEATQFFSNTAELEDQARLETVGPDLFVGIEREACALAERIGQVPSITLSLPKSHCPKCGKSLAWYKNLPLVGWFLAKGRCATCEGAISLRYPVVELMTGLLFVGAFYKLGGQPSTLIWCGFLATLLTMSLIDADTQLLPDSLTLPLLWAGIGLSLVGFGLPLEAAVWGAIAGYLPLWLICEAFRLITGRQGMGHGDFKLLAALGAWLGYQMVLPIILLASLFGISWYVGMRLGKNKKTGEPMPFGPFLCIAAGFVFFHGAESILSFFRFTNLH